MLSLASTTSRITRTKASQAARLNRHDRHLKQRDVCRQVVGTSVRKEASSRMKSNMRAFPQLHHTNHRLSNSATQIGSPTPITHNRLAPSSIHQPLTASFLRLPPSDKLSGLALFLASNYQDSLSLRPPSFKSSSMQWGHLMTCLAPNFGPA